MIVERPSAARGDVQAGWLESRHTFSFGSYYDPDWMGFGVLRVINEDKVAPRSGFPAHGHANMEILSYVLEGALAHRDSLGGAGPGEDGRAGPGVIRAGQLQWMSAGHGVEHSEFNASADEPVHFLQIWLQPDRVNAAPAYALREAVAGEGWQLLASPDGREGSVAIRQDALLRLARFAGGDALEFILDPARRYWLHVARGTVQLDGRVLQAGDALGFVEESGRHGLRSDRAAEVLLFDLPL
jgi:redox-sensitive bicupin YhaK (pirin superfamily)